MISYLCNVHTWIHFRKAHVNTLLHLWQAKALVHSIAIVKRREFRLVIAVHSVAVAEWREVRLVIAVHSVAIVKWREVRLVVAVHSVAIVEWREARLVIAVHFIATIDGRKVWLVISIIPGRRSKVIEGLLNAIRALALRAIEAKVVLTIVVVKRSGALVW